MNYQQAKILLSNAAMARANFYSATEALEKVIGHEIDDNDLGALIDSDFSGITQDGLTDNQAMSILVQI
ncbi:hypothetical protein [Methylotenera sp.]|uniref:hypothetical protein n=1 Tax=Methylotenera sp. TaxID=2051956 RepID=UPI002489546A|nr:hypothetical protein [Methylotenera sp.]MDI1361508.1 hypothetical protein [Methylotenera sp.]